LQD
jgi:serine/threonine-protein phosphatase 2A regulatory subunit B'